jgi:hypothetical protein
LACLKFTALNGCWKKLWPEAISYFWGFLDQQDEVRISLTVSHKLQEADTQKVLNSSALTGESQDEEYLLLLWLAWAICECPLNRGFRTVSGLVTALRAAT